MLPQIHSETQFLSSASTFSFLEKTLNGQTSVALCNGNIIDWSRHALTFWIQLWNVSEHKFCCHWKQKWQFRWIVQLIKIWNIRMSEGEEYWNLPQSYTWCGMIVVVIVGYYLSNPGYSPLLLLECYCLTRPWCKVAFGSYCIIKWLHHSKLGPDNYATFATKHN